MVIYNKYRHFIINTQVILLGYEFYTILNPISKYLDIRYYIII